MLELGCGVGLLAVVLARLGARRVVATDGDPRLSSLASANARRNGVASAVESCALEWANGALRRYIATVTKPLHVTVDSRALEWTNGASRRYTYDETRDTLRAPHAPRFERNDDAIT